MGYRVARDNVGEFTVSTVFLALDHQYSPGGPPLLFETAVFSGAEIVEIVERYSSVDEAEMGHAAAVEKLRKEGKT